MIFGDYGYKLSVINQRSLDGFSGVGAITSGVLAFVYDAGTKTLATIYADANRTSLANPITRAQFATDGAVKFWCAASTVDIVVAHSDGSVAKYASVAPTDHVLPLNQDGVAKCLIVPFGASDNTETDTGIDLPRYVHIHDVAIEVVTTDATEDISVGLLSSESSGDADGLLVTASVATAGLIKPYAVTAGGSETYVSTSYYGALMGPAIVGSNVDKDNGIGQGFGHFINGSTAVSLTYTGSSGSDTAAGYIYVWFQHLR